MHMSEENWKDAQSDFFESFRNYDEAGSLQRIQVLKYLLLTTMLMRSDINPFDSQETKPYKNDPRIAAMTDLVDAYQRDDIHKYEDVLHASTDLLADPFIAENIDEVTRTMRTKAVLRLIAPYTRMRLPWIASQLRIGDAEVQDIIGFLIVDGRIRGRIDQSAGTVEIESSADADRIDALGDLAEAFQGLYTAVFRDGDGFRGAAAAAEQGAGTGPGGVAGVDDRMNYIHLTDGFGHPGRYAARGGTEQLGPGRRGKRGGWGFGLG